MGNPELSTATADLPAYELRVWVDGSEVLLPFMVRDGKDYAQGEPLVDVAKRAAESIVNDRFSPIGDTIEVHVHEPKGTDCTGDDEPVSLAVGVAYRWSDVAENR